MAYLQSSAIEVFPTTRRAEGRRITEENLSENILSIVDKDSFVAPLRYDEYSRLIDTDLVFCIHGYVFKIYGDTYEKAIEKITTNFPSSLDIWAWVHIIEADGFEELEGQDDSLTGLYKGLNIVDSDPLCNPTDKKYQIHLLTRATLSDTWAVPTSSYVKFNEGSVGSGSDSIIDGGSVADS